jgi:hypothetical protein
MVGIESPHRYGIREELYSKRAAANSGLVDLLLVDLARFELASASVIEIDAAVFLTPQARPGPLNRLMIFSSFSGAKAPPVVDALTQR